MTCNKQSSHSAILFFKIITTPSLEAGKLVIPNGFTKIYSSAMSNPVFLKLPDDQEWKVFWEKHDDGHLWFHKGWKEFTSYYSLDHGHLLLFDFIDTSHFELHIFDKSTFEIEYPRIHGNQDEQNNNPDEIMSDNSVEILDDLPPSKKTRQKSPISHPQPLKKLRTEALSRAGTLKSEDAFFTVRMKPQNVDGWRWTLYIPSKFAEKHLKKKREIILEVLDGRTWSVSYNLCSFGAGWKKFALDNKLKVGDVCRFELQLNKGGCLSLKVIIIPLVEEIHSRRSQGKQRSASSLNSCHATSGKASQPNGALDEANKFIPENPFFRITIQPSRWNSYRPYVPFAFIEKHFKKKKNVMLQFGNNLWPVKLVYSNQYYAASSGAKLSKGWTLFAEVTNLEAGDVCVFELINKEDVVLHVHIFKG